MQQHVEACETSARLLRNIIEWCPPWGGGFNPKYRPKVKPTVMGVYEVYRIVAKRVQGGRAEYFIQWQSYSSSENTWEPAEHLPEELITAFKNRSVDPFRADEYYTILLQASVCVFLI